MPLHPFSFFKMKPKPKQGTGYLDIERENFSSSQDECDPYEPSMEEYYKSIEEATHMETMCCSPSFQ